MKYPLNNIEDTNFWHYSLQLSTYAWMIEKMDPRFNIKSLTIIHYDHDGGVSYHECEYLKNDVERMLADYKRKIRHEQKRSAGSQNGNLRIFMFIRIIRKTERGSFNQSRDGVFLLVP